MPIPSTYLPSTIIQQTRVGADKEEEALDVARQKLQQPVDFDFSGAYEMLREKGFDERTAMDTIAIKLGEKNNFDVQAARKAGFTNEVIVAKLIGRDPDDLVSSPGYTLAQGFGRGALAGAPAGAAGYAAAAGLGALGVASAPVLLGGGLLTALVVGATGVGEALEDVVFDERELLPSERPFGVAGETLGAVASLSPTTQVGLKAIPDAVDFGSKRLMARLQTQREAALKVDPTSAVATKGTGKIARRQFLEDLVSGVGKRARESGPTKFAAQELFLSVVPAAAEGFAEAYYPGDDEVRLIAGIAGSLVPTPGLGLVAEAGRPAASAIATDIDEKGFRGSAANLFGLRDRGDRFRRRKAAEFIARAYETSGGKPIEFADELDRLIAADPTFAASVTPGQLTNNPFFLLQEAITRKNNPILSEQTKKAGQEASAKVSTLIETLKNIDNQEALQVAGELETKLFTTQLQNLIDQAMLKAANAAEKAGAVRQGDLTSVDISKQQGAILKDAAVKAMEEAKEVRRKLYAAVDKRMVIDTTPILQSYRQLSADFLLTAAGDLKGDLVKDLQNYGLDLGGDVFNNIVTEAGKRKKTLTSRLNTIGSTFQKTAQNDPEAFSEFDLLVDTLGGPQKRGYEARLDRVILGFGKKADEEGALGAELPQRVRANVLKLAQTSKEVESVQRNIRTIDDDLSKISLSDFVQDEAVPQSLGEILAFRNKIRQLKRTAEKGFVEGPTTAQLAVLDNGVNVAIQQRIADGLAAGRDANLEALSTAERYANSYNQVFNQTFAGELGRSKAAGADVIDPETALDRLFLGMDGTQAKRVEDMLTAMRFEGVQDEDLLGSVTGAMDAFLRDKLARMATPSSRVNPITGEREEFLQLTQKQLDTFKDQYKNTILALDPDGALLDDLSDVAKAQTALEAAFDTASDRAKTRAKEASLGSFLEAESAEKVVTNILIGDFPEQRLGQIARDINRASGNEAYKESLRQGLFSTVLGSVISKTRAAPTQDGKAVVDFRKLYDVLYNTQKTKDLHGFDNFKEGGVPLAKVLQNAGVLPEAEAKSLKEFLQRGKNLQEALADGADDFINYNDTDAMKDFVARFGGAQAVSEVAKMLGLSPTIQTTGAGAKLAQNQFLGLPQMAFKDLLIDISKPGGASALSKALRAGATENEQIAGINRAYGYVASRLLGAPSYYASVSVRPVEESTPAPTPAPPVASPIAGPAPAALTPQTPPAAARPPAAPDPNIRQRYAALYPNDPVSSLIEQQGIAGLPQAPR
jgi:hypothetical protein